MRMQNESNNHGKDTQARLFLSGSLRFDLEHIESCHR